MSRSVEEVLRNGDGIDAYASFEKIDPVQCVLFLFLG